MRQHLQGIDHVVVLVRDLDRAQQAYARMGFTLTPRGFHTLGSQNHCLMFGSDYVELLAVPRPHPALRLPKPDRSAARSMVPRRWFRPAPHRPASRTSRSPIR